MKNQIIVIGLLFIFFSPLAFSQKQSNEEIRSMVTKFKNDDRGPYKDIRWFCEDGSINMPKEPCGAIGGVQRARYKDEVVDLAKTNHLYLGQILSTTPHDDFWDEKNANARIKQYQIEKFLRAVDDGWILKKGQFYRGAFQIEDEEKWGIDFFNWVLKYNKNINNHFYLIRQAARDIPHYGDDNLTQNIRALSKNIADNYSAFMPLRIKIHGQPDNSDLKASKEFLDFHRETLSSEQVKNLERMIKDMEIIYRPLDFQSFNKYLKQLPAGSTIRKDLETFIDQFKDNSSSVEQVKANSEMLLNIRTQITDLPGSKAKLALLDISLALEDLLFKNAIAWRPRSYGEMMDKIYHLGKASTGCGYLELWEWQTIESDIRPISNDSIPLPTLIEWHENARKLVEWGAGTPRGVYRTEVERFNGFEPLAYGFFDDKTRSSLLLPLGEAISELGNVIASVANFSNQVLDIPNQSSFRGLNPGYALGELVVVSGSPEEVEVSKNKIYIFHHPPSDLKPVAGIATVSEGNMVSHVQLLARNLGIPNAVLSEENLNNLKKYDGERVFYAVSNKGTVLMKLEKEMNEEERKLFEVKKRSEDKIEVPIEKINLENTSVLNMRDVRAKDSGKLCGPKAANLGQLKSMFPDRVVEGIVIPFGIFRQHMDQIMPNKEVSYWTFLNDTFLKGSQFSDETEAENFMLQELEIFRNAIKEINFTPEFTDDLKNNFSTVLGAEMGNIPVFLRSDTNMEDLKDFTGAGLNLTLFNVLETAKILQGIRDVWASPYTERSYKWRQKYLLNPENVYPSILIIPSVDVDYSGVLITKGITTGKSEDMTVAFSRGAGGAVDGQAAESYLLFAEGKNQLLSPAREPSYRKLPSTGGTVTLSATYEQRILNKDNLEALRALTKEVNEILPNTEGIESAGPFDIELGFKDDKMWLFQIRPFVENKNAKSSAYLESISPKSAPDASVAPSAQLPEPSTKENTKADEDQIEPSQEVAAPQKSNRLMWWSLIILAVLMVTGSAYFFINRNK